VIGAFHLRSTTASQRRRRNLQPIKKRLRTPGIKRLFCHTAANAGNRRLNGALIVQHRKLQRHSFRAASGPLPPMRRSAVKITKPLILQCRRPTSQAVIFNELTPWRFPSRNMLRPVDLALPRQEILLLFATPESKRRHHAESMFDPSFAVEN